MNDAIAALVARYPDLEPCASDVQGAYDVLRDAFAAGGKLLACGNGGSAADCEHVVGELMKGFYSRRPVNADARGALASLNEEDAGYLADHLQGALPAISLVSHTALTSAIANDVAPDMVFAQQVYGYGRAGDALLCISTSGNSANVVRAAQVGRALGLSVVGLTGAAGGRLAQWCDVCVRVPHSETSRVQERHLPVYHTLCQMLESEFFPAESGADAAKTSGAGDLEERPG